jgi:MYXO-CTERM domain-containing protein
MNSSKTLAPRAPSLKPTQITGYLAGAVGTAALLGAPQTEAAVTAVNFGFGPQFTTNEGGGDWTVGPGFGTLAGHSSPNYTFWGARDYHGRGMVYSSSVSGIASFFANGTVIGAGANGALGVAHFNQGFIPPLTFTTDQLNKNMAFKTTTNNWGWANVSWTVANKTLTIHEAWVESVANTPITINAAPEPSRALLALAGLGGVALRRRRKQAA